MPAQAVSLIDLKGNSFLSLQKVSHWHHTANKALQATESPSTEIAHSSAITWLSGSRKVHFATMCKVYLLATSHCNELS